MWNVKLLSPIYSLYFIKKEALECKDVLAPWYLFLLAISQ